MTPPYDAEPGMARLAAQVRGIGSRPCALPPLLALTDPQRTPDPLALAASLPSGSALLYRHFGAADRFETGAELAEMARARGLVLLVSADRELADRIGAHGIHWPERLLGEACRRRVRGDRHLFTAAAHTPRGILRAGAAGIDAVLYSPVFPSLSPSAGRAKGIWPAAATAQMADIPVYALGGVDTGTVNRLRKLGFSGVACVGATAVNAIRSAAPTRT